MKLLTIAMLLLTLEDSKGLLQVSNRPAAHAGSGVTSERAIKSAPLESSLLVRHMLMNNDSVNSSSSSSQQQSKRYFQNIKASAEIAKSSDDESSFPITHQKSCSGLRMAHGAICPETIAIFERDSNPAIRRFVETYHKRGPLACEDLLSDPEVLPALTKAMRDIHA